MVLSANISFVFGNSILKHFLCFTYVALVTILTIYFINNTSFFLSYISFPCNCWAFYLKYLMVYYPIWCHIFSKSCWFFQWCPWCTEPRHTWSYYDLFPLNFVVVFELFNWWTFWGSHFLQGVSDSRFLCW